MPAPAASSRKVPKNSAIFTSRREQTQNKIAKNIWLFNQPQAPQSLKATLGKAADEIAQIKFSASVGLTARRMQRNMSQGDIEEEKR